MISDPNEAVQVLRSTYAERITRILSMLLRARLLVAESERDPDTFDAANLCLRNDVILPMLQQMDELVELEPLITRVTGPAAREANQLSHEILHALAEAATYVVRTAIAKLDAEVCGVVLGLTNGQKLAFGIILAAQLERLAYAQDFHATERTHDTN